MNLYSSKPFQLSFITSEGPKETSRNDYYIDWPNLKVSSFIEKLTNLSWPVFHKTKQKPEDVLTHFEKYLYDPDYLIVGHNISNYDIYIHNTHRRLTGRKTDFSYVDRIVDTNCLSKSLKYEIPKASDDSNFQWQTRLNSFYKKGIKTKQEVMLKEMGIDFDPEKLHNSLYDVDKNKDLFFKLIWRVEV